MTDTTGATSTETGTSTEGDAFTPPATQADLDALLDAERAKFADYSDLKAKATEFESVKAKFDEAAGKLTAAEKLAEERATALAEKETALAGAELKALKATVAAVKGVPVKSLVGTTEDELNAHADELLAWKGVPRGPKRQSKSGLAGAESTSTDPKDRAAAALRNL